MIIKSEIKDVVKILDELRVPFYFHAGFGLHLRGLESELDDCDIRVFHPGLNEVYEHVKQRSLHEVRLRGPKQYERGTYDNMCVQILNGTNFDICGRMLVDCDIGRFEFPFTYEAFSDISYLPYDEMTLPVASPESLFLYYLILRRTSADGKNDEQHVKDLLTSGKLDKQKFEQIVPNLPCCDEVQKLYSHALRRFTS